MFFNFQYLSTDTYGKVFSCIHQDTDGVQWHIHGERKAGESNFRCVITPRSQIVNPEPVLHVRGIDGIHVLMQITDRVNRWNTRETVGENE